MLNLHHLEILQTVAAFGSYSRAAERLGISQPAVSMQIRKLEEHAGLPLVTSRGREVVLTEAGQALAAYAAKILRLTDEAEQVMLDYKTLRRGRLRIGASSTPGAYLLPGAIASFRAAQSGITVTLDVGNTRTALKQVQTDLVDLAVVGYVDPDTTGLHLEPLCDDRLMVVVAPGHPWAAAGRITAAQLAAEPLILREQGSSTRAVLDRRLLEVTGRRSRATMELGATEAVKEAVAAGLGPAVLSGLAVRWELAAGRLVPVVVEGVNLSRTLHLALRADPGRGALAHAFAAHLRQWAITPLDYGDWPKSGNPPEFVK